MASSNASLQPISVFGHYGKTPNPPKVLILLDLLKIPYTFVDKDLMNPTSENGIKHPSFTAINPNGRVPAITDPNNNNRNVFESAAILYYLCEHYDPTGEFFGKNLEEKTTVMEWLAFQISGQGPYQGQIAWFSVYHEKVYGTAPPPDIAERFRIEMRRVYKVVEGQLERQKAKGSDWLVLDRLTVVDISWHVWAKIAEVLGVSFDELPELRRWLAQVAEVPEVKKVYEFVASPPQESTSETA